MGVNWVPVASKSHALSEPAGECETLLCSFIIALDRVDTDMKTLYY